MTTPKAPFSLAHWRQAVAEIYAAVRGAPSLNQPQAWERYRSARDNLFRSHPQTPLTPEQHRRFTGLDYYAHDPAWRIAGTLDQDVERESFAVELPAEGLLRYRRVARVHFVAKSRGAELSAFWIEGYGGGLFLPFRDATSGQDTYGGGRYLYDTIKGTDLGVTGSELVLDFNYAYNPSCAYNAQWVYPLAPLENWLPFTVKAGEKAFKI